MNNNILFIINDDNEDLDKRISLLKDKTIYITSYNLEILEKYKYHSNVKKVFYLEEMHTVFESSEQTIDIITKANEFLKLVINEELIYVQGQIEGGNNQSILDIVLFKLSFDKIITDYKIDLVENYTSSFYYKENKFIKDILIENKIEYLIYITDKYNYFKECIRIDFKRYFKGIYDFFSFLLLNIKYKKNKYNKYKKTLFVHVASNMHKFYDSFKYFTDTIEQNSDYKCKFITNGINITNEKLIQEKPYILEHYMTVLDFFYSFLSTIKYLLIYKTNQNKFNLFFNHLPLSIKNQINNVIYYEIIVQYGFNIRYKKALNRFFSKNTLSAWKLWGGVSLPAGKIAVDIINSKYSYITSFIFDINSEFKYYPFLADNLNLMDYKILFEQKDKEACLYQGYEPNKLLLIPELNIKKNMLKLKNQYTQNDSMKLLNIKNDYLEYIFIDINVRIRGIIHIQEIEIFIYNIKLLAIEFINYAFIIKPHPRFQQFEYLKNHLSGISNIYLFTPELPIFHFLNISTVVITKLSAIGFEALTLGKVLICVILDDESNWEGYGDNANYFFSFIDVIHFLHNIQKTSEIINIKSEKLKYKESSINDFLEKIENK